MVPFFVQIKCQLGKSYAGGERARRCRDRLGNLFDRRRLRPAGEVLRRTGDRHRPFRQREGADHPRHPGHPHDHHLQGLRAADQVPVGGPSAARMRCRPSWRSRQITNRPAPATMPAPTKTSRSAPRRTPGSRAGTPTASTCSRTAPPARPARSGSSRSGRCATRPPKMPMVDQRGQLRPGRRDPAERPGQQDRRARRSARSRTRSTRSSRSSVRRRVWIIEPALEKAPSKPSSAPTAPRRRGRWCARCRDTAHSITRTPTKPTTTARPAIDAHALLEDERRQRHRDQRRGERDRGRIDQRQPRQRREIAEHAADADHAAPDMAERPLGADRGLELAAPGVDHHHRQDREGRAEEHHLPDRITVAEIAHEHRHARRTAAPRSSLSRMALTTFIGGIGRRERMRVRLQHVADAARSRLARSGYHCAVMTAQPRTELLGFGGFGPSTGGSDFT